MDESETKADKSLKRDAFTLEYKFNILKFVDDNPGLTKKDITKLFGLKNSSTLVTIINQREKIMESYETYDNTGQKKIRRGNYWDLEEALSDWLKSDEAKNVDMDNNSLICKANELAGTLSYSNFRATSGWVDRFRNRHGLMLKHGNAMDDTDSLSSDIDTTEEEDVEDCSKQEPSSIQHLDELAAATLSDIVEKHILNWIKAKPDFGEDSERLVATTWTGPICNEVNKIVSKFGVRFEWNLGWIDKFVERNELKWGDLFAGDGEVKTKIYTGAGVWADECLEAPLSINARPRDIFSMTETCVLFRTLPEILNAVQNWSSTTCPNGEHATERVTVLVCTNMDASEKEPLVVVGKFPNPHALGVDHLPLTYESDTKAWINTDIFASWLQKLDQKMQTQNRKVVLLLKLSSVHDGPKVKEIQMLLKAVTLLFLPNTSKDCIHKINPMDLGIVQALKEGYRRHQLKVLVSIQADKPPPTLTLRHAMNFLDAAWREISPQVIWSSFRKCGLLTSDPLGEDTPLFVKVLEAEHAFREITELQSIYRTYRNRLGIPAILTLDKFTSLDNHILVCQSEEPTSGDSLNTEQPIENWEASDCLNKLCDLVRCPSNPPENIIAQTKPTEDFRTQDVLVTWLSRESCETLKQPTILQKPAFPNLLNLFNEETTDQEHGWTDGPQIVQIDSLALQENKPRGNIPENSGEISNGPCIVEIKSLANQSSDVGEGSDINQNDEMDKVELSDTAVRSTDNLEEGIDAGSYPKAVQSGSTVNQVVSKVYSGNICTDHDKSDYGQCRKTTMGEMTNLIIIEVDIGKPKNANDLDHSFATPITRAYSHRGSHLEPSSESLSVVCGAGPMEFAPASQENEGPIIVSCESLSEGGPNVTQGSEVIMAGSVQERAATPNFVTGRSHRPVHILPRILPKSPTAHNATQADIHSKPRPYKYYQLAPPLTKRPPRVMIAQQFKHQKQKSPQSEEDSLVSSIHGKHPAGTTESSTTSHASADTTSSRKARTVQYYQLAPPLAKMPPQATTAPQFRHQNFKQTAPQSEVDSLVSSIHGKHPEKNTKSSTTSHASEDTSNPASADNCADTKDQTWNRLHWENKSSRRAPTVQYYQLAPPPPLTNNLMSAQAFIAQQFKHQNLKISSKRKKAPTVREVLEWKKEMREKESESPESLEQHRRRRAEELINAHNIFDKKSGDTITTGWISHQPETELLQNNIILLSGSLDYGSGSGIPHEKQDLTRLLQNSSNGLARLQTQDLLTLYRDTQTLAPNKPLRPVNSLSDKEWEDIFKSAIEGDADDDEEGSWVFQWLVDAVVADEPNIPHTDDASTAMLTKESNETANQFEKLLTGLGTVTACEVLVENPLDGHSADIKPDVDDDTAIKQEVDNMEENSSTTTLDNEDHWTKVKQEVNACKEELSLKCEETLASASDEDNDISGYFTEGNFEMPDSPEPSWFSRAVSRIGNESDTGSDVVTVKDEVDSTRDVDVQKQEQETNYQTEHSYEEYKAIPDIKQEGVANQGDLTAPLTKIKQEESPYASGSNQSIENEPSFVKLEGAEGMEGLYPPPADKQNDRGELETNGTGSSDDTDSTVLDLGTEDDQHKYPVVQVSSEEPLTLIKSNDIEKSDKDNNAGANTQTRKRKRTWTKFKAKPKKRMCTEKLSHEMNE